MRGSAPSARKPRRSAACWIFRLLGLFIVGIVLFMVGTAIRVARQSQLDETRLADAILVFGAAEYSGRPSPVFRARLDHAYSLWERGIAPVIITTGGAGFDPTYTEGGVGRDYLISKGIPDQNMIAETQGEDTAESAERAATIMRTNHIRDCVAVSDAYHMFRIKKVLKDEGIMAYGAPRPGSRPRTTWGCIVAAMRKSLSYLLWQLNLT